jgi:hypothetical protein
MNNKKHIKENAPKLKLLRGHFPGTLQYLLVMVVIDNLQGKTPYYLEHFPQ